VRRDRTRPRFTISRDESSRTLIGRRAGPETPRRLLGKATPCIGRDKELALLQTTVAECIDDKVARMVLVTGPPGSGKSRLASELVARVRETTHARVLQARGETLGGHSLIRELVRRAADLNEEEPVPAHQTRFFSYMNALFPEAQKRPLSEFLGEAFGVPTPDVPSPQLIAARNDPRMMGEYMERAVFAWLSRESARQPLVVVLEDFHWADSGSVARVETAISQLTDRALFVLALARPEVLDQFPRLWERPAVQEIKLGPLTRRASERLVRAVLGDKTESGVIARIVDRAGGNAFYLEELIRNAAEGGEAMPETVMVLATSRIERLEPDARRILRASSVFGEAFWANGVASLLGGETTVPSWLDVLAGREVLDRARESRFAGEAEYRFRHAILRDAAYAMLTEGDRKAGHSPASGLGNGNRASHWLWLAISNKQEAAAGPYPGLFKRSHADWQTCNHPRIARSSLRGHSKRVRRASNGASCGDGTPCFPFHAPTSKG
jgi:predicted ATPase